MLINQLNYRLKKNKRVGRGGKKGSTSGRGQKGQKARAGHRIRPASRDLILKFPKKRGSKFKPISPRPFVFNLNEIENKFQPGERVSSESLRQKKILKVSRSLKKFKIKILAQGELTKKLIFAQTLLFSDRAKEKIVKSGSIIEEE
ncbi:MAG: uL15 family ribosomal protein [Patescibacteria group bacterium]|nr:uL15 family ribosomal protein [Patescibacteria group bacterium]MCL5257919.1 uL15 family ribosomal protein [Patescibacteria group bacterium]